MPPQQVFDEIKLGWGADSSKCCAAIHNILDRLKRWAERNLLTLSKDKHLGPCISKDWGLIVDFLQIPINGALQSPDLSLFYLW